MSIPSKTVKSVTYYQPGSIPENPEYLGEFVIRELNKLGDIIYNVAQLRLEQTNVEPEKPRDGDIRYADGTNWNPGSGVGIYAYIGAAWTKLS
tara:strand:+ start:2774 stop:3052 length:279 start_codon:yes stop_codon:yes gene_type:complete